MRHNGVDRCVGRRFVARNKAPRIDQGEVIARSADAAFDGADRCSDNRAYLFVRKARSTDQEKRFALVERQQGEGAPQFIKLEGAARVLGGHEGALGYGGVKLGRAPTSGVLSRNDFAGS